MVDLGQIIRVVQQLQSKPYYLFLYLDALVEKDSHLVSGFADLQVRALYVLWSLKTLTLGVGQTLCRVCYLEVD